MELNHKIMGEGDPIIIMHGLFGMLDNWQSIAKELSQDYMVILIDLRNHGKSPHSDEWNVQVMARDVIEFMQSQWIFEATIIGHSMGGKVAMQVALTEPDMVSNLIVVDIAPRSYERGHDLIFTALNSVPIETVASRGDVEEYLGKYISETGIKLFLMKNLSRNKDGSYRWKMNLPIIEKNYESILQPTLSDFPYEGPTLFISGERSDYIREEDQERIIELFPEAKVETISNAGHWVHADQKDAIIASIRSHVLN